MKIKRDATGISTMTAEEAMAIQLPHGGVRTARRPLSMGNPHVHYNAGPTGKGCCVRVFEGRGGSHLCPNKAVVTETVPGKGELDFCRIHSSAATAAREQASDERYKAHLAKTTAAIASRQAAAQKLSDADRWKAALEQIAAGDNDPRRTAMLALGIHPEPEKY